MARPRLVRLALLGGVAACLLIAFGMLPGFRFLTDLSQEPAVIANDTGWAVEIARCTGACPVSGGSIVEPGAELRAAPPGSRWIVHSDTGSELGCLGPTSAGQRLRVSTMSPCGSG